MCEHEDTLITTCKLLLVFALLLVSSNALCGGDQRFDSGEVSYQGQFPEIGPVKKAHEFPMDHKGALSPYIPQRLLQHAAQQPLSDGFIDVTKPPYSVVPDGQQDVTRKIQDAIDDAYLSRMIVFFPSGIYLVSDQLKCHRPWNHRWSYVAEGQKPNGKRFSRITGYQLVGPQRGEPAVLKLRDHSKVTDNVLLKFIQYDMDGVMRDRSNYGNTLRNISIDMGDNPEVSGVTMPGAQYSSIEDVHIYGASFDAGIKGMPGSGGSMTNIKVTGGKTGLWQNSFRPGPLVAGLVLSGQSESAIRVSNSRGSVTVTGFRIEATANSDYRAVRLDTVGSKRRELSRGMLAMQDGSIHLAAEGAVAIATLSAEFALKNVYVHASNLAEYKGQRLTELVAGEWNHVTRYAFSESDAVALIGGEDKFSHHLFSEKITIAPPPADLVSRHGWGDMPAWDNMDHVNVVKDYGATPSFGVSNQYLSTGDSDDKAIQQAIDDVTDASHPDFGKIVFIPHGDYRITKPIRVKASTRLIGAGKTSTVLQQAYDVWEDPSQPVLITEDTPDGNITLSDFYILAYPRGRFYDIQSGNTIIRDLQTHVLENLGNFPQAIYPYATFSGHASGKVYNLCSDHVSGYDGISKREPPSGEYSLLKISNNSSQGDLSFYQASIEHLYANKAQVIIDHGKQVNFYSLKHEPGPGRSLMAINDTQGISILTTSGHYGLKFKDQPMVFSITRTPSVEFILLSRQIQKNEISGGSWLINGPDRIDDDSPSILWYKR